MKGKRIDGWSVVTQLILWSLMGSIPFISVLLNGGTRESLLWCLRATHFSYLSWMLLFYVNYFLLIPRYLFRKKKWHYFAANFVLIVLLQNLAHYYLQWLGVDVPSMDVGTRVATRLGGAVLNIFLILASISLRVQERNARLEVEAATLEVERLKSQLNPHFLFNTLNNISSLISLDPDGAQTSISRLSDMLRYVLYDSAKPKVPLADELKFLEDYIDLMRLRYADTLRVEAPLNPPKGGTQVVSSQKLEVRSNLLTTNIPPLLFITLVENAFKHGASSRHDCYIRIGIGEEKGWLCFSVTNSLLRADELPAGKAGGVGLKNLGQRLRLLYKEGDYALRTEKDKDCYHAELKIRI